MKTIPKTELVTNINIKSHVWYVSTIVHIQRDFLQQECDQRQESAVETFGRQESGTTNSIAAARSVVPLLP